jgi:hypothetical protein
MKKFNFIKINELQNKHCEQYRGGQYIGGQHSRGQR